MLYVCMAVCLQVCMSVCVYAQMREGLERVVRPAVLDVEERHDQELIEDILGRLICKQGPQLEFPGHS